MQTTTVINSVFRKLIRVNEAFKQREWQEVFDVILAVVVHYVFEKDQMESALSANGNKVTFTMSWGEQFGSIRSACRGFTLSQVCHLPVCPHYGELIPSNLTELEMGRNFQIPLV